MVGYWMVIVSGMGRVVSEFLTELEERFEGGKVEGELT